MVICEDLKPYRHEHPHNLTDQSNAVGFALRDEAPGRDRGFQSFNHTGQSPAGDFVRSVSIQLTIKSIKSKPMKKSVFFLASFCIGTGLLSGCSDNKTADTNITTSSPQTTSPVDTAGGMAGMDHTKMGVAGSASSPGMVAAMNTMMGKMNAFKPAGNTDHDFAHMMMAHHQGAVEMSALELQEGKDATLRAMARKISADQQQEIKDLEAIATRLDGAPTNYKPNDPADPFTSVMKSSMDGMMKPSQPTGNVDADYARLMVPHHQSAVDMARAEVAHGRDTKLKEMAQAMIDAQQKEIQQFKDWQAKNGGKMKAHAAVYESPMGYQGRRRNQPGKRPACGMTLEKQA